jgi:formate dehydrogenase subunit delta
MTTKNDSIIKMSNQIADNIGLHLSTEDAADKVLNHIRLFWAKSMKNDLIKYYQEDGARLGDTTKRAVEKLIANTNNSP